MKKAFVWVLIIFSATVAQSQQAITNDTILKLVKAEMSEDVIMGMINSQASNFTLGTDDLAALKKGGVPQRVIAAMVVKGSGPVGAPAAGPAVAPQAAPAPSASVVVSTNADSAATPKEIGVYYKAAGNWVEMEPEVINFKTGGVLKSMGTYGIVKGDINGHINGARSKTALKTPVEIVIYTPEGVGAAEYQLLHLHTQNDSREFRTVTGGVFHKSGGATRDAIEFEGKKTASRTYTLSLNLKSGEYGILPPSSGDSTGSSGRLGKIYSFQVIE